MAKVRLFFLSLGCLLLAIIGLFLSVGLFRPKLAGLNINTSPTSTVLINNQRVGITPYRDFLKPGRYVVRLVPEMVTDNPEIYDSEVNLEPGVETVIRRTFGAAKEQTSGYTLTFERASRSTASISVVTDPDASEINIDSSQWSLSPFNSSSIPQGNHSLTVKKQGFSESTFGIATYKGFRLVATVKLSKLKKNSLPVDDLPTPSVSPTEFQDRGMGFIEIVSTPTGFLRVRSEPSTLGEEVGRAEPGKKYVVLGTDTKTGWYKIEYEKGKSGWVSNQYSKKVE